MTTAWSDPIDEAKLFHQGLELFNTGQWFDAHEVWEDIWHIAGGEKKRFYQGLIQCAVTIEHLRRGNPRGARNVYGTAMTKFDGLPEVYLGINVPGLLSNLRRTMQPVLDLPETAFAPGRGRGQSLPVDLSSIFQIKLEYDPFDVDPPRQKPPHA